MIYFGRKRIMSKKKSNLDEMQELKLLKIENSGFWLLYWGMFATIMLQILLRCDIKGIAILLAIFLSASIYLLVRCIKDGIWDRHLKANLTTNLLVSLVAALFVGGFQSYMLHYNYKIPVSGIILSAIFFAVGTFVLCIILLSLCSHWYKKRSEKLESENID